MSEPQSTQSTPGSGGVTQTQTQAIAQCKSQLNELLGRASRIGVQGDTVNITPGDWQKFMTGLQGLQTSFAALEGHR